MNDKIKEEKENFIAIFEKKNNSEMRLHHYHSVLNLSEGLLLLNNDSSHKPIKGLMLEYFIFIKERNYLITQKESLVNYKNYILPVGQHLINHSGFRTRWDILKYIGVGLVIDILSYLLIENHYFFATPLFIFLGYYQQKNKKRKKKFFSINW